jgi:ribose transport system ATP-binding protein
VTPAAHAVAVEGSGGDAEREGRDDVVLPRVRAAGVSKTFGRSRVLDGVDLTIAPGEVHALLGQNGSGKSTLIKILSGLYRPDAGSRLVVDGRDVPLPATPTQVMEEGLTFVHQSLGLIPGHSVTENIRLGALRRRRLGVLIDWKRERAAAEATLQRLQVDIDPDEIVDRLPMGARATVAIARALQTIVPGQGCVVLDESTQSLPRDTLPEFYATLGRLAAAGTSVLVVSHRLEEVTAIADRVTVLRDGRVVCGGEAVAGRSHAALAQQILGKELVNFRRPERAAGERTDDDVVRIRGARGRFLEPFDVDIHAGEIVGVTGPPEGGHEELPYLLAGVLGRRKNGGTIEIGGRPQRLGTSVPGVALVPADRLGAGLAETESALANLTLPRLRERRLPMIMRKGWQRREFRKACDQLDIKPDRADLPIASFSGGNQQKILLAKWLLDEPTLLVLHEPTQAVDVGARADILRAISDAAAAGAAVLLSSIEAEDLALVCDRVLVLDGGTVSRELRAPIEFDDFADPALTNPVLPEHPRSH